MDTPLAELGLAPEELRQLSPAVQKLTKADLVAAAEGEITQSFEVLTVRDLNSITQVYVARAKGVEVTGVAAANGCCCCTIACCCSCCAASVDAEHVTVAA